MNHLADKCQSENFIYYCDTQAKIDGLFIDFVLYYSNSRGSLTPKLAAYLVLP